MNDFEDIHRGTPEQQFDLLVDGELSEADRRALLVQLEHEPDGWRRCALAFLEAQCWREEFGQTAAPAATQAAGAGAGHIAPLSQVEPAGRRQSWRQYAATSLTMAASFLIALVVGMGLRGNWSGGSHDSALLKTAVSEFPLASRGALPAATVGSAIVPAAQSANDWETVTLAAGRSADGPAETFRVRALRRDTLDQNLLEQVPDAISPELQQAFEQAGHRVVQQREIVPLQMKDGRRLVVPVDHIEIHYVGRPSL